MPWLTAHFATEEGRLKMSIHSLIAGNALAPESWSSTGLGNDKEGRSADLE